jgi:hypothetical protein
MKQNTQNGAHVIIRIPNITIIIYNLQNSTKAHKTYNHIYTMIQNRTKRIRKNMINESHKSSKQQIFYSISSNSDWHPVAKTFTPLHYTSPNYTPLSNKVYLFINSMLIYIWLPFLPTFQTRRLTNFGWPIVLEMTLARGNPPWHCDA